MNKLPTHKQIRIENFDYATPSAYFINVCTANREKILWDTIENNPRKYLLTPAP